jgi:TPR repeat protein
MFDKIEMQDTNNLNNNKISDTNNSLHDHFIQNFSKMDIREIEPTTKNINKSIYEEDLSVLINELINLYSKMEGKEEGIKKQHIFYFINNHEISLQEIYNWLLNNSNDSNSIYLLGYFNYYGIETNVNKRKAFKLYQKAAEMENNVAQYKLSKMYLDGKVVEKNFNKVFELSKKLAEKGYLPGLNRLGYCYDCGIGTNVDKQKAFELYQKAANLGNIVAQYNIALMYEYGKGIEEDVGQAIFWYKKSAEQGDKYSKNKLKTLLNVLE